MKAKQAVVLIGIILVVALIIFFVTKNKDLVSKDNTNTNQTSTQVTLPEKNIIYMNDKGFKPNLLIIKQGDTVTWYNNDTVSHRPSSNNHPSHKVYPGSSIENCGTANESSNFDSCRDVSPGQIYSFTFDRRGTWKYHDHLSPGYIASIAVQ